ncbi:hypothetical protein GBA52_006821 [Prunus armeniaca]|nr:hypothetical protein GBA52_006821 [Prunus armeniaca]
MPEVLPLLKNRIKESSIDKSEDCDEVSAASARVPVGFAIAAAYQFRWFVTQIDYPHLGKLSALVIPCALTALDHWSPEIKGQGMLSFIHIAKNVYAAELGWYQDVILDACCQNIASSDEIWHLVVEMSVLIVTCTQQSNPRSAWFDRMLNEMLSHLERQPRNKERRVAWLRHIEPLFNGVGLVLLAHFRRIFPLFFQWMHADDDETVLLVLKQIETIIKLTWIRNTQYVERLVDELAALYKEAALKRSREEIRNLVIRILILLHQCKGLQFETVWGKHRDDPNLASIVPSLGETKTTRISTISVGNDPLESSPDFSTFLLPAIRNLHLSLRDLGIRKISVSTTFSFISIITTPFPPSSAQFLEPALYTVVRPLLQFLRDTNSSFLVNLYPYNLYKIRSEIPIGFPLFQEHPFGFRDDLTTGVRYRNLFDMMVDAVISAMAVAGYENIPLIVTETGWPSFSTDPTEIDANPIYAELYLKGLLCHLRSGKGTPLRKEGVSETYIYELLDKQMRKGRNWGILYPNLTAKYKYIQFSGSYCRGFFDMLIMAVGQFLVFAFLRGNGSFSLL